MESIELFELLLTIIMYGSLGLFALFLANKLIDDHFKRQTDFKLNMMMIEHNAKMKANKEIFELGLKRKKDDG